MNTQTRVSRAFRATVLGSVLAALVLVGGPAGAGADPTGQTSGGCLAAHGSVCSGSGAAIDGSTSSGDAVAVGGSTASGCSTALDGSTASGGNCAPERHAPPDHHRPSHKGGEAPEARPATPTAASNLTLTG